MSYIFDGVNDILRVNSSLGITTYPFTISAWVKQVSSSDSVGPGFFSQAGSSDDNWYGAVVDSTDDKAKIFARSNSGYLGSTTQTALNASDWHHLIIEYSSNQVRYVYLDNVQGTTGAPTTINLVTPGRFSIGGIGKLSQVLYKGRIAEVAVYNVVLTLSEKADLANGLAPSLVAAANLQGYWTLLETGGLADMSSHGLDLTAIGSPVTSSDHPVINYGGGDINLASATLALSGSLGLSGTINIGGTKMWNIPTTAANGTVRRVTIFDETGTTIEDFSGSVTSASALFSFAATDQMLALDEKRFALLDDYDGNTASTLIRGHFGIATLGQ
jgi:hypothetical protein